MTGKNSKTSQEDDNEPLREPEETPIRHLGQPLVSFMHELALTIRTKDELEPPTMAQALGLV